MYYTVVCKHIKYDKYVHLYRFVLRKLIKDNYEEVELSFVVSPHQGRIIHLDGYIKKIRDIERINSKQPQKHIKDLALFLLKHPKSRRVYEKEN